MLIALWLRLRRWLALRPDPSGQSLGFWLAAVLLGFALCWSLGAALPLVWSVPWLLLLSAGWPFVSRVVQAVESPTRARWLVALEVGVVSVVVAALAWQKLGFIIKDHVPIDTGDHQVMFVRAEAFTEALRRGVWLRWTHLLQGGDSLTDLYPYCVNLLTSLLHFAMPRGTPFWDTYSAFVVVAWCLRVGSVYFASRRFTGVFVSSALALASGLEVGTDVWDGVWHGVIYWGMIHSNVALSIALFACGLQVDLVRRVSSARIVACALLVALTAFAHPLGILFAGFSCVGLLVALAASPADRRNGIWALGASALGLLIAAVWILPFSYAQKHFGYSNATQGLGLQEFGRGIVDGSAPSTSFKAWTGFAIAAMLAALFSGEAAAIAVALCALLFWLFPVYELLIEERVLSLFPTLLDGQHRRMFTVLKSAGIPACAWLAQVIMARLPRPVSLALPQVLARAFVMGLVLVGPARGLAITSAALSKELRSQTVEAPARGARQRSHTGHDYNKVFDWLDKQRKEDPSKTRWRVAITWTREWRHATWAEGFINGTPIVDYINVSSNFLGTRPREVTAEGFKDWNIRFLVTETSDAPFAGLTKRMSSGRFTVWEFDGYDDRYVVAPDGVRISNIVWRDNDIEFKVSGAPAAGALVKVRTAHYPRWVASGAASELTAVQPHPGAKPRQEQIGVRVHNGLARISCTGPMPRQLLGLLVSILGAGALFFVARERRRDQLVTWLAWLRLKAESVQRRARGRRRILVIVGAVLAAALLLVLRFVTGSNELLLSPAFAPQLRVVAEAGGKSVPCQRDVQTGFYSCEPISGVTVSSLLGTTGRGDSTWEYAYLWPAINVDLNQGNSAHFDFPRVLAPGARLALEARVNGSARIGLVVGGVPVAPQAVPYGNHEVVFQLPPHSRVTPVRVTITSVSGKSSVAFRRIWR
ncbi:MAG TPA: hypothetical protein VHB79_10060 [Polyangiaceae bacterium]|nr:hypothetical protein [Polyangiaceae bacterium]